ncbi:MAG TPA: stage II sporulation protein M [Acidimicrobiales bacterium]|nr:stage II sporulation protein M [Acidimicrobiales bacterium]
MTAGELEELVTLYGQVSTHLSHVRTNYSDRDLSLKLSSLIARAGACLHGSRSRGGRPVRKFFSTTLPGAVWDLRPFIAVSAALTFVPAIFMGIWLSHSPSALSSLVTPKQVSVYVNSEFANYYRSAPALEFAFHVYINNVVVSILAFAVGALLCLPAAYVLIQNGLNIGVAAGILTAYGKGGRFWVLVLPHGMVELTSVVIAGAAGLSLGWSLVAPGDRTRLGALAEEGRKRIVLVMGVALSLAIAGSIEGTVTGSSLPPWVRLGIGILAESAIIGYLLVMGPRASAAGATGSLDDPQEQDIEPRSKFYAPPGLAIITTNAHT